MADKRKLQTEIDRTMKKVDEGVELFDEIWEKVYSARDPNHKEKYEQDLKKEIKKLQRHRDQIKTWLGQNDIKDKKNLTEARKLIETKMEQFKVCEKEAKTKMFSKEGLAREQKVDPKEAAKNKTREWLGNAVSNLNTQMESFDADLERLSAGKGKSKNKDEIAALEESMTGHRQHVAKLEQIIRLMDNDLLETEAIDDLKEEIEYFVESNQEPDYQSQYDDDMEVYDALDLDEAPIQMVDLLNQGGAPKKSPREGEDADGSGAGGDDDDDADKSTSSSKTATSTSGSGKDKKGGIGGSGSGATEVLKGIGRPGKAQPSPSPVSGRPGAAAVPPTKGKGGAAAPSLAPAPATPTITRPMASAVVAGMAGKPTAAQALKGSLAAAVAGTTTTDGATTAGAGGPPTTTAADVVREKPTQAAVLAQAQAQQQQRAAAQRQQQQQQALASQQQQAAQQKALQQQQQAGGGGGAPPPGPGQPQHQTTPPQGPSPTPLQQQPTPPLQPSASPTPQQQPPLQAQGGTLPLSSIVGRPGPVGGEQQQHQQHLQMQQQQLQAQQQQAQHQAQQQQQQQAAQQQTAFGGAGGLYGSATATGTDDGGMDPATAAAFAAGNMNKTAPETLQIQMNFLNRAMLYIPTPHDAERPKQYFPRNPYPVNTAFPLAPAPIFESPAIFEKLGPDTLFFIFYYQQGTYQQYLAAKELKKQSWRYHKKYMTWFQRHEEPTITTDEYEQGTYVYFDCESGWCTRIKQSFEFRYDCLENEDMGGAM